MDRRQDHSREHAHKSSLFLKKSRLQLSLFISLFLCLLLFTFDAKAQIYVDQSTANAPNANQQPGIKWSSQNANDVVTIQNGTGATLVIQIVVDSSVAQAGVNVSNCGNTTHINSGSTAICVTHDPTNPVSFVTDNATKPVSGIYTVQLLR